MRATIQPCLSSNLPPEILRMINLLLIEDVKEQLQRQLMFPVPIQDDKVFYCKWHLVVIKKYIVEQTGWCTITRYKYIKPRISWEYWYSTKNKSVWLDNTEFQGCLNPHETDIDILVKVGVKRWLRHYE